MWPFSRGRWIDHPCKPPIEKRCEVGDKWQCRCGQIWKVVRRYGGVYRTENSWSKYEDPIVSDLNSRFPNLRAVQ